jgi:hypothetical protein
MKKIDKISVKRNRLVLFFCENRTIPQRNIKGTKTVGLHKPAQEIEKQ